MKFVESLVYANRLRSLHPAYKVALTLSVIASCLILNAPLANLVAIVWMSVFVIFGARVPARAFFKLLAAETIFLMLSLLGIMLNLRLTQPENTLWVWRVGPLWFSSSPAALEASWVVLTRALGAASAMNFLALTTPITDLTDFFRRLRVPEFLIDIMAVMYRFVFVLLEMFERMYTAQDSRLGYINRRRAMQSASLLASQLFVATFHHSQKLQIALDSRGYDGALRVLPFQYRVAHVWLLFIAAVPLCMWIASQI